MECTLMHKNIPVMEIALDDDSGVITAVGKVYDIRHIPVCIPKPAKGVDRRRLNEWWMDRAIPASRQGIRDAMEKMRIRVPRNLPDKCFGLSLSDQYWICPDGSNLSWKDINFFDNPFSEDVGNILFGKDVSGERINFMSPDNTTDGWLQKKWIISEGKRCLVKGGSGVVRQEPYNEVLASMVMRRLHIPHVSYALMVSDGLPCSICEDFITRDTELVSAWHIMQTQKKPNHVSMYQHYLDCCRELGIPGAAEAIDGMITVDFLIANTDRHLNNFGVVRNAETLEWIGPAPIYDNGTSMWFDRPLSMIRPHDPKIPSRPFKASHAEQIKLARIRTRERSFHALLDWLDLSVLSSIEDECREILKDAPFIDDARRSALCYALKKRVDLLQDIVR